MQAMVEFCKSEMSDENINFWREATSWREQAAGSTATGATATDSITGAPIVEDPEACSRARTIIETYIRIGASYQINLPGRVTSPFAVELLSIPVDIFDDAVHEIATLLRRDTFERFQMSDAAGILAAAYPELALGDAERAALVAQTELQKQLEALAVLVGCERVTVWIKGIGRNESMLYAVCSTRTPAGNAIISVPVGTGNVGQAAATGEDVITNPDEARVDTSKVTDFVTRSLLCAVLKADEGGGAFVQLINKQGKKAADGTPVAGSFTAADAAVVRETAGDNILRHSSASAALRGLLPAA